MIKSIRPWWKLTKFAFVLVGYFIWLMIVLWISGKNQKRGFRVRRNFCKAALRTFKVRVHASGKPHNGGCLYISNHRSMIDPIVELSLLDTFILSKADVNTYPLLGKGARETGVFFVERESDNSRKAALQSIEKILKSGESVLIYPEGTTNGKDLTDDFRKGAFEVAFNNNLPVVPIMIEYPDASYYWTDKPLMDYFKDIFSMPGSHNVQVQIGDPVHADTKEELVIKTRATIDEMILNARHTRPVDD